MLVVVVAAMFCVERGDLNIKGRKKKSRNYEDRSYTGDLLKHLTQNSKCYYSLNIVALDKINIRVDSAYTAIDENIIL